MCVARPSSNQSIIRFLLIYYRLHTNSTPSRPKTKHNTNELTCLQSRIAMRIQQYSWTKSKEDYET